MTSNRPYALFSRAVLVIDLLLLTMVISDFRGPVRLLIGLAFGLFVPGWSLVGLLRLSSPVLEFAVTVAVSLSLLVVVAQIALTIHSWNLKDLQVFLSLVCIPPLAFQSDFLGKVMKR